MSDNEKILEKLDIIIELLTKLNAMIEKQEKYMEPKEMIKRSMELQKELQKEMAKQVYPKDTGQYT